MKITDFHVHPYLEQSENLCTYKDDFQLTYLEARADLEKAGITKICGSVIGKAAFDPEKGFEQIQQLNARALELKALYGDFYEPGFQIHPEFVKESLETLEFMHQNGYRLIGELVPYHHGWGERYDYGCKELMEILALAGEYGFVYSYHTMDQWEQMESAIAQNPKLTFVAAHPGEKNTYMKHLEILKKYDNAYLDLSGTGIFRYGMLREGIRQVGDEKFLFGTDYPIINPGMYVQAVCFEHFSDKSRENIFYKNAERILGV